jgi:hypothetical protein
VELAGRAHPAQDALFGGRCHSDFARQTEKERLIKQEYKQE